MFPKVDVPPANALPRPPKAAACNASPPFLPSNKAPNPDPIALATNPGIAVAPKAVNILGAAKLKIADNITNSFFLSISQRIYIVNPY